MFNCILIENTDGYTRKSWLSSMNHNCRITM